MDRLEELKLRYDAIGVIPQTIATWRGDFNRLILEIERSKKENDYLLTLCAGPITGCMTNLDEAKKWVETNMQRALKEE